MHPRVVVAAFGAISLLGVAACGSSGGTGAAPATTLKLGTPSYQTLQPQVTSTLPAPTIAGQPTGVVPGEQLATVAAGDYLVKIAKTYCISAQDIITYNGWVDGLDHDLQPGNTVKIPPNSCAPGTATTEAPTAATSVAPAGTTVTPAATPSATSTTLPANAGGTYTVVAGDYLEGIAKKTGTTVAAIVAANGWADSNHVIIPGQSIKMPAPTG